MEAVCEALLDRDGAAPSPKRAWEQDSTGRTALHVAGERCMRQLCLTILRQVAAGHAELALDAQDASGRSPLHVFADLGWLELGKQLLEADAAQRRQLGRPSVDLNCRDGVGRTPFHVAAERGFFEFCELLVSHPTFDPNAASPASGQGALHLAIAKGYTD